MLLSDRGIEAHVLRTAPAACGCRQRPQLLLLIFDVANRSVTSARARVSRPGGGLE